MGLRGCFSNPSKATKALISRTLSGSLKRENAVQPLQRPARRGPEVGNSRTPQTRLNASNRSELLEGYAAGLPVDDLAKQFKIHRGTVRALAKRAGLDARRPELPPSTRAEAARLYATGLSLSRVAQRLGIGDEAVRFAALSAGGTVRPRGRRPVAEAATAID